MWWASPTCSSSWASPFDSPIARTLSRRIAEEIYFHALSASADLAEEKGRHPAFEETRAARGELQFDAWGVTPEHLVRWDALRARIRTTGLRNSLLVAIAPTATIASIAGCYECIEPQVSNLFKRETLSGDFLQVNRYLVAELKELGLWNDETRTKLKLAEGSVQSLTELPETLRAVFRTAWEHVLPAIEACDADREGHGRRGRRARRPRREGRRVLAREPRDVRGLPVIGSDRPQRLLDPGLCLTLRPMAYPRFFEMYRAAVKNTWSVEEVDLATDVGDLAKKMSPAERHLVQRLVAFFATGDSIVANNLVLNLYKHVNAPEARMYLSRQLFEEALHVQFYLTLLDTYVPDPEERHRAFAAVENIPSIRAKAAFCMRWLDSIQSLDRLETRDDRRRFLLNLICFAACIEGLFFFGAFAYVYFLRSRGLLHGLAGGTNWVFRDESAHMAFAFEVVNTVRREEPELFDDALTKSVVEMVEEAIDCETQFAEDILGGGVAGLAVAEVRGYLEFCADQRLVTLGLPKRFGTRNPLAFMDLQDVQEVTKGAACVCRTCAVDTPARIRRLLARLDWPQA